jgi:hypothetical protein
MNSHSINTIILKNAFENLSTDIVNFILKNKNEGIYVDESDIEFFYKFNRNKPKGDEMFSIMLEDNRFDINNLIKYSIKFDYLADLIILLNSYDDVNLSEAIKFALNKAIKFNNLVIVEYLTDKYEIPEKYTEEFIVQLDRGLKYEKIPRYEMLDLLLKSKKYDSEKLLIKLSKKSRSSYSLSYLLTNYSFKTNLLKNLSIYIIDIDDKIIDILLKQKTLTQDILMIF